MAPFWHANNLHSEAKNGQNGKKGNKPDVEKRHKCSTFKIPHLQFTHFALCLTSIMEPAFKRTCRLPAPFMPSPWHGRRGLGERERETRVSLGRLHLYCTTVCSDALRDVRVDVLVGVHRSAHLCVRHAHQGAYLLAARATRSSHSFNPSG